MQTKKEYSPIKMTLIASVLLLLITASYFLLANSRYGSLTVNNLSALKDEEAENQEIILAEEAAVENESLGKETPKDKENEAIMETAPPAAGVSAGAGFAEVGNYKCYMMTDRLPWIKDNKHPGYQMPSPAKGEVYYRNGDDSYEVKKIEETLVKKGYLKKANTKFDDTTEAAVKKFQKSRGITADGAVGPGTANKLGIKGEIINKYSVNANGGSPRVAQHGSRQLINILQSSLYYWNISSYGNKDISIGDLNDSPNHKTHDRGTSVDLYSKNKIFRWDYHKNSKGQYLKNKNYKKYRKYPIFLAKKLFNTNSINFIIYGDPVVVSKVNKYISSKGLQGKMYYQSTATNPIIRWDGRSLGEVPANDHKNHFHVEILPNVNCNNGVHQ